MFLKQTFMQSSKVLKQIHEKILLLVISEIAFNSVFIKVFLVRLNAKKKNG
jgi:hypothetical protein